MSEADRNSIDTPAIATPTIDTPAVASPPVESSPTGYRALDARLHAFRPDLADERLQGRVPAPRFVAGWRAQIGRAVIPMRGQPAVTSGIVNEALYGERLTVFEIAQGFAWVQLERDGYVGYVPAEALHLDIVEPTHRVQGIGTFVYPAADIKAPPVMHLSLGSEISVTGGDETFLRLASGGFVVARHVAPRGKFARDFVVLAERLIGVPYLWGGRTRIGVDCSGLVQLALEAGGQTCPRDSDMQQATLGATVLIPADLDGLERGDLVFWKGHVGIMVDGALLIHANAHHMAVAVEPLVNAAERISKAGGGPIAAIKRLVKVAGA